MPRHREKKGLCGGHEYPPPARRAYAFCVLSQQGSDCSEDSSADDQRQHNTVNEGFNHLFAATALEAESVSGLQLLEDELDFPSYAIHVVDVFWRKLRRRNVRHVKVVLAILRDVQADESVAISGPRFPATADLAPVYDFHINVKGLCSKLFNYVLQSPSFHTGCLPSWSAVDLEDGGIAVFLQPGKEVAPILGDVPEEGVAVVTFVEEKKAFGCPRAYGERFPLGHFPFVQLDCRAAFASHAQNGVELCRGLNGTCSHPGEGISQSIVEFEECGIHKHDVLEPL